MECLPREAIADRRQPGFISQGTFVDLVADRDEPSDEEVLAGAGWFCKQVLNLDGEHAPARTAESSGFVRLGSRRSGNAGADECRDGQGNRCSC